MLKSLSFKQQFGIFDNGTISDQSMLTEAY